MGVLTDSTGTGMETRGRSLNMTVASGLIGVALILMGEDIVTDAIDRLGDPRALAPRLFRVPVRELD